LKINSENILLNANDYIKKQKIFLITGNEETLIDKISELIIARFKTKKLENVAKYENKNINKGANEFFSNSLFDESKVFIHSNPKDVDLECLKEIEEENLLLIIKDNKIKNSSKIKKYFDAHPSYASISCYKLTREIKKKIMSKALSDNNIKLNNDSYWFILDFADEKYKIFEDQLQKIILFEKSDPSLEEIKLLISPNLNENISALFFSILLNNAVIIKESNNQIKTQNDAYLLLQKSKFYIDLLARSKSLVEARDIFPTYLFLEKERFLTIFGLLKKNKITNILRLIKKTELMLRKNGSMFLPISQRFLLNIKKNIN